jgi:hypothetical protein
MPSLTITDAELDQGLALLAEAVHNVAKDPATTATPALSQIPPQMPAPTISPTFSNPSLTLPGNSSTLRAGGREWGSRL